MSRRSIHGAGSHVRGTIHAAGRAGLQTQRPLATFILLRSEGATLVRLPMESNSTLKSALEEIREIISKIPNHYEYFSLYQHIATMIIAAVISGVIIYGALSELLFRSLRTLIKFCPLLHNFLFLKY